MMFMRHISLFCEAMKLHLIMKVHITYSVQTKTNYSDSFLFISFKMQFSEEKKAPLDRVGRKVKKIYIFLF